MMRVSLFRLNSFVRNDGGNGSQDLCSSYYRDRETTRPVCAPLWEREALFLFQTDVRGMPRHTWTRSPLLSST